MTDKIKEIVAGFKKSFWVANIMELFERIAYYGQATILSIYLRDYLKFTEGEAGQLSSIFGGLIYFLPIFAGAIADKIGFRKAFMFAFSVLAFGYFLIGSVAMDQFSGLYSNMDRFPLLVAILVFTAIGGSFIKPSVLGTIAFTSTEKTKSLGYAIYYWLVNIGGAVGPLIAYFVRDSIGIQAVFVVSAISCLLMVISTFIFFEEPTTADQRTTKGLGELFMNLLRVLSNIKFMIFLTIFAMYWLMFWQIFIIIPYYVTDFISKDAPFELIQSVGAWSIILLQLVINRMTKDIRTIYAIILGFAISALCWGIIFLNPTIPMVIAGLVVFSIGEQTQAPRYYEYIADIAPKGQVGLFQGYAFLPVAMGWVFGGTMGGYLYETFAKAQNNPNAIFLILFGIGIFATLCMFFYNMFFNKTPSHSN